MPGYNNYSHVSTKEKSTKETQEKREERLQKTWETITPCAKCAIVSICKYAGTFKRVNYNADVFTPKIECNIRNNFKSITPSTESTESEDPAYILQRVQNPGCVGDY